MKRQIVEVIENFVEGIMHNTLAHDYRHVDRVRNLSLYIAKKEKYENLEMVQTAALLHDVGLIFCKNRRFHGEVGAEFVNKYLLEKNYFTEEQVNEITDAIKYHNSKNIDRGKLLNIIRDADTLDLFGAIGIMRAFTSKYSLPEYDLKCIKGTTWEKNSEFFDKRFSNGLDPGPFIVDQINFQISCYDNLITNTAKDLGKTYLNFMKLFVIELELEVKNGKSLAIL